MGNFKNSLKIPQSLGTGNFREFELGEAWGMSPKFPKYWGRGINNFHEGNRGLFGVGTAKILGNFGDKISENSQISGWGWGQYFRGIWPH